MRGARARRRRRSCGSSIPIATTAALRPLVHRWTRGDDLGGTDLDPAASCSRRDGSLERAFARGLDPAAAGCRGRARGDSRPRARAIDLRPVYGRAPAKSRRALFLQPAVDGIGLQAAQSLSALDGAPGRGRSGRLDHGSRASARRAARHAHDSSGEVPAIHAPRLARLEDGRRDHRGATRIRSRRSGALRLRACAISA